MNKIACLDSELYFFKNIVDNIDSHSNNHDNNHSSHNHHDRNKDHLDIHNNNNIDHNNNHLFIDAKLFLFQLPHLFYHLLLLYISFDLYFILQGIFHSFLSTHLSIFSFN
jgi:hypothetical protein